MKRRGWRGTMRPAVCLCAKCVALLPARALLLEAQRRGDRRHFALLYRADVAEAVAS